MDPGLVAALTRHHGVLATADLTACGIDRSEIGPMLRRHVLRRIRYGVYTTGARWLQHERAGTTHHLECAAVLRRLGRTQAVVSHTSAARLHGLVVPGAADGRVSLTDPEQFRTGKGYVIKEAPLPASDVVLVDGLPVTSLARTLADVGRSWDVVDTVVAADDALADGRVTLAELRAAALAQTHWRGAGRAARALGLARVGAHSPHETRSRLELVQAGLPEPMLQAAVFLGSRLVAVLDMYWEDTSAYAECDGRTKTDDPWWHQTPGEAVWAEKVRHDQLVDLDLHGTRLKPADLFGPLPLKVARLRELLGRPGPVAPRYRIEQRRDGLREEPRVRRAS